VSLTVVYSRAQVGIESLSVAVEVHLANGLPGLSIVGLPESAVENERVRVASDLLDVRAFLHGQRNLPAAVQLRCLDRTVGT